MPDLSVIIPARNEEFLQRTVEDVLKNARADTECIAILDGYWPDSGLPQMPNLNVIHNEVSIGQRAATNQGARLSTAKYIMKLDAHCSLDEGFDVKLMSDCQPNWTVLPRMYVLDAFHWVCTSCKKEFDQGPVKTDPCPCGNATFEKKVVWARKRRKRTDYMWFDTDLRIAYFDKPHLQKYGEDVNALKKKYSHKLRGWSQGDLTDVMCGIGACWFLERDWYWELGGMDEKHGSWGQMAVELACKTWLAGGRHVANKKTWFSHLPRTQKGFSWPYPNPASAQQKAREHSKDLWLNNKWPKAKHNLEWLIRKFGPLPGWDKVFPESKGKPTEPSKGMVYYTDNQCEERLAQAVRDRLQVLANGHSIVSVSLYPLDFGTNVVLPLERGDLTMFTQILTGLEAIDSDIVFLTEHDVLYHPSHFEFTPPRKDTYYYNHNTWKVDAKTGQALHYLGDQVSGLCAYRELMLEHYRKRVARVEKEGFTRRMGFEPGKPFPRGIDNHPVERWWSEGPNLDVRHANNRTWSRWKKEQFRRQPKNWVMADEVPGWGVTKDRFDLFLRESMHELQAAQAMA